MGCVPIKIFKILCLFFVLVLLLFENSIALTKEEATNILKELIMGEFKILEIREAPIEGFWEVSTKLKHEKKIFYIHKNLRFIIHGEILDGQTKRNLTLDRLKEFRRVDVSSLPLENSISMGEGKRKLYVLTDPECHFCHQLHEELKLVQDLQTFFFLYPLNPNSNKKAKAIWCSQDRLKALEGAYQGMEIKSPNCDIHAINKNIEFGRHFLIDSTPTLIFQNGKIVEGYVLPNVLENLLKSE